MSGKKVKVYEIHEKQLAESIRLPMGKVIRVKQKIARPEWFEVQIELADPDDEGSEGEQHWRWVSGSQLRGFRFTCDRLGCGH